MPAGPDPRSAAATARRDVSRAPRPLLVDGRALGASGIGRYLEQVLVRLLEDPRFAPVTIAGDPDRIRASFDGRAAGETVRLLPFPTGFYRLGHQLRWAAALRGRPRGEIAFFPHFDAPWRLPSDSVVTIHDLTHFILPEHFPAHRRLAAGVLVRRVVSRASRLIVPSEATRQELIHRFAARPERITVAFEGVDTGFWTPGGEESRPPMGHRYLLSVGNRKRHKNHAFAVDLLAALAERHPDLRLVIVGRPVPAADGVGERARALGVADRVHEIGDATDRELREWYRHAAAFLFPSRYEGFGLPALEAMGCGAPVVASDGGALPEVVGDAGLIRPVGALAGWREALDTLLCDRDRAAQCRTRGLERARGLSWAHAADTVADVLAGGRTR